MFRKPFYQDDTDYNTNSPSYYDDLARKSKLVKLLAKRIWEYDKVLFKSLEEVNAVLDQVIHKIGEGFNQEIHDLLVLWVEDGTLDHIINVTLMNKKADITYVDQLMEDLTNLVNQELQNMKTDLENDMTNLDTDLTDRMNTLDTDLTDQMNTLDTTVTNKMNTLDTDLSNRMNTVETTTTNKINELGKHVPKNHYVSSDFPNLQSAVYGAEGGVLHIVPATYLITTPIKIRSNTKIIAYGSTFRRNADINNMFINDSSGTIGGYGANENIEIHGGTFDGAGGTFVDNCTIIAMGHARNILIKDCNFRNLVSWHMIELNAVANAVVEGCTFTNYGGATTGSEMLQIDIAKGSTQFPWFGPYDDTTCTNIMIRNNRFTDGVKAIGTHSSTQGKEHTNITIRDNMITNMREEAIYGMDWGFVKIQSNHFYNVFKGVVIHAVAREINNHDISDNYMYGKDQPNSRGIQILGIANSHTLKRGTITNNKVYYFNNHGIGIDYCDSWIISNNEIIHCGRSGIIVFGSENVTVGNNVSIENMVNNETGTYDISISITSKNVAVNGNNAGKIYCSSEVTNCIVSGNLVGSTITVNGTRNHAVNNVVNGAVQ